MLKCLTPPETNTAMKAIVLSPFVRAVALGAVSWLAAARGGGQVIAALLFGVSPFEPVTLGVVLVLFTVVAAVASSIPAARACRTDPIRALRSE